MFSTLWWLIFWTIIFPFAYRRFRTWHPETGVRGHQAAHTYQEGRSGGSRRNYSRRNDRDPAAPHG